MFHKIRLSVWRSVYGLSKVSPGCFHKIIQLVPVLVTPLPDQRLGERTKVSYTNSTCAFGPVPSTPINKPIQFFGEVCHGGKLVEVDGKFPLRSVMEFSHGNRGSEMLFVNDFIYVQGGGCTGSSCSNGVPCRLYR